MQPQESNISPAKNSNRLSIVFSITTLAFAGLAAFFGVNYFKQPAKTDTTQSTATQGSIADEYTEIKGMMADVLSSIINSPVSNTQNYVRGSNGLAAKLDGMNAYTMTNFSLAARILSNNGEQDLATLKNKLTQKGFSAVGTLPTEGSAGPQIDGYKNDSNTVCGLYLETEFPTINLKMEYINFECTKPSWNWIKDEKKAFLKDLEAAYFEKTGKYPTILGGQSGEIKDSAYSPYQTTWMGVGGAAGLFYRTSSESKWQYFTATQSFLYCDEYNTDDLKKAYLGEECYERDNVTQSTVQL